MGHRPIDVAQLSDQQLQNTIDNHRRKSATDSQTYIEALAEQARRTGNGLDFSKSFEIISRAASEWRFVSYKELADESKADWKQVHYSIGRHLWALVEYAHRKGWPMLSAIVVNKQNVSTGKMEPKTLKGFVAAARALGHSVPDGESFLNEQQRRVFEWGEALKGPPPDRPK